MTDDTPPRAQATAPHPSTKAAARQARLSAALRENLLRRKEATRARPATEAQTSTKTGGDS